MQRGKHVCLDCNNVAAVIHRLSACVHIIIIIIIMCSFGEESRAISFPIESNRCATYCLDYIVKFIIIIIIYTRAHEINVRRNAKKKKRVSLKTTNICTNMSVRNIIITFTTDVYEIIFLRDVFSL